MMSNEEMSQAHENDQQHILVLLWVCGSCLHQFKQLMERLVKNGPNNWTYFENHFFPDAADTFNIDSGPE